MLKVRLILIKKCVSFIINSSKRERKGRGITLISIENLSLMQYEKIVIILPVR